MIERLDGFGEGVLAYRASGKLKGEDFKYGFIKTYSGTFIDAMKEVYEEAREQAEKAGEEALKVLVRP